MVRIFLILFLSNVFITKGCFCQEDINQPLKMMYVTHSEFIPYYLQLDKDPFLFNEWSLGSIKLINGEEYSNVYLKIDIYNNDLLIFNKQLNKVLLVDRGIFTYFELTINDEILKFCNLFERKKNKTIVNDFYEILVNDSIGLYRKSIKEINEYTDFKSAYGKLGTFFEKERYYIVIDKVPVKIIPNKRSVGKIMPVLQKDVSSFIRKNKLKPKRPDDLKRIIEHLNYLIKNGNKT